MLWPLTTAASRSLVLVYCHRFRLQVSFHIYICLFWNDNMLWPLTTAASRSLVLVSCHRFRLQVSFHVFRSHLIYSRVNVPQIRNGAQPTTSSRRLWSRHSAPLFSPRAWCSCSLRGKKESMWLCCARLSALLSVHYSLRVPDLLAVTRNTIDTDLTSWREYKKWFMWLCCARLLALLSVHYLLRWPALVALWEVDSLVALEDTILYLER